MSRTKKWDAGDLRAEMARRGVTRREIADILGISYSYVRKILSGIRSAEQRRAQIGALLDEMIQREKVA